MKAIVFGGSGFVGSHVADALTEAGHEVSIFDLATSPHLRQDQRMILGDILDEQAVREAVRGQDMLYNFAGVADIDDAANRPLDTIRHNILGNGLLLEAARQEGVSRYIFASTIYVYSDAGSFYRCSKAACENYIEEYQRRYGLDYTILRYGTLYGPRADMRNSIHRFLTQALTDGRIVYPGDGTETREYIHVMDAAKGSVEILDPEYRNQCIIFTGHHQMKVADMFTMITEILRQRVEVEYTGHGRESLPGHYKITPYTFTPKMGRKYVKHYYMDMGQGLLMCIEDIYHALNGNRKIIL